MIRQQFRRRVLPASVALVLSFVCPLGAAAQDTQRERKNIVYGEFFGAVWGGTINYERRLTPRFSVRLGSGFSSDFDAVDFHPALLAMPNVVFGQRHQLTLGVGPLILFEGSDCVRCLGTDWTLAFEVGYRYRANSGFFIKATVGAYAFSTLGSIPAPGVGLGWSF